MIKKIHYITYQTFPSEKANTIQTIENLRNLNKEGVKVDLIYPLGIKIVLTTCQFSKIIIL